MGCIHCGREIANKGSLKSHEACCKQNPNRVQHSHSPFAGKQKGASTWNKGLKTGQKQAFVDKRPNELMFVADSGVARCVVRRRILAQELIEYRCACCGIGPEWQGKPMPLILDHINGVNNDNRLENLRFVCSNCDTQLDTYKSRNRKKK